LFNHEQGQFESASVSQARKAERDHVAQNIRFNRAQLSKQGARIESSRRSLLGCRETSSSGQAETQTMSTKRARQRFTNQQIDLIQRQEFVARKLVDAIVHTFFRAYFEHAQGESREAIIIDHDIEATACDAPKDLADLSRAVINCACDALDKRIHYIVAHEYLFEQLSQRMIDVIRARCTSRRKRNVDDNFVRESIEHAIGGDS
jgi:hypothetical protein